MIEELSALANKLAELNARLRAVREENLELRMQLASHGAELDAMKNRVALAMRRLDELIEQLPADSETDK